MLGVHYKGSLPDHGVVPYEASGSTSLCCNLQLSDLSRVVTTSVHDESLQIGSVLEKVPSSRRLPALIVEVIPISD